MHHTEEAAFQQFLARCEHKDQALDIPTGTGRMLPMLKKTLEFDHVIAADYSLEMLKYCQAHYKEALIAFSREDIYQTSFNSDDFDAVLSSRFLFHCDNQPDVFKELHRILKPGGYWVFDTLSWSPRRWSSWFSKTLGGNIYTNSQRSIKALARTAGFNVVESTAILMFPSFIYNFLPSWSIGTLQKLEALWPAAFKTKRVWILQKREV